MVVLPNYTRKMRKLYILKIRNLAFHFDADPDPTFYFDANTDPDSDPDLAFDFDANPDPAVTLIQIRRNRLPK